MQKYRDDSEALLQMADGNIYAYRFLFDHHFVDLCNFLLIYLHRKELAEEIALDIFTFIWEHRQTLQIKANFKSFLFAAAKNKAITLYRKEHQKIFASIETSESVMPHDSSSQFLMENNVAKIAKIAETLLQSNLYVVGSTSIIEMIWLYCVASGLF